MGANGEQRKLDEPKEFVVTTFASRPGGGGVSTLVLESGVWNGRSPFALGYPVRWVLERAGDGARIRRVDGHAEEIIDKPLRSLKSPELSGEVPIELEPRKNLWIRLQPVLELEAIALRYKALGWAPRAVEVGLPDTRASDNFFHRGAIGVAVGLLLVLIGVHFIPTGQVGGGEAIIPEEYAKVLLSPALKSAPTKSRTNDNAAAPGNVVQAFRSQAVQKTAQSLLNPAAAKALLSRTSLLDAGSARAALKGMLDGKSSLSTTTSSGDLDLKDVASSSATRSRQSDYTGKAATTATGSGGLAAISFDSVGVSDGLTKEEVGKVIREHLGQIRYCYEAALARSPGLEGKLLMAFTVGADGTVKDAQTKESSGNAGLDSCIKTRLLGWKFPKPRQGVDIGVTYPFIFKSLSE